MDDPNAGKLGQGRRLVVVSNRVPPPSEVAAGMQEGAGPVGGLVSAVKPAMQARGGLWVGWSGSSTRRRSETTLAVKNFGDVQLATLDLSEDEISLYYTGFANRTLWPLLHSFPTRVIVRHDTYRAYRRINERFARALMPLLRRDDLVWIHDYHLFHLGQELRNLGWEGKTGYFLHVPFPSDDVFSILPWSDELLKALLHYDLVGFHTERYVHNAIDAFKEELKADASGEVVSYGERSTRLGAYPIGIEPSIFAESRNGENMPSLAEQAALTTLPSDHSLILGVDRLDYTKGIPERLMAFERLLEHHSALRGKVTFIQISSPSRTRVPEYVQEKQRVEGLVGQINGRFSDSGWVPIRYLYRSYPQTALARFYRDANVCIVSALRDGMNLVAKEFVAAQRESDPGVLVLSKFSGAAAAMREAVLINPYDIDGSAEALIRALRMPVSERRQRNRALQEIVFKYTAANWSDSFQADLASS
ncbi:MAG: trehalose-6-phosphate synthase [Chloroflexi bacterium]|nr:trehalose-6-phosphate synthase [Chloroflexota bacterium]